MENNNKTSPAHPAWSKATKKTIRQVKRALPPRFPRGPRGPKSSMEKRWAKGRGFPTSFVFDRYQYLEVCKIAAGEKISRKEMVFRLIKEGLKKYNSGEMDMNFETEL